MLEDELSSNQCNEMPENPFSLMREVTLVGMLCSAQLIIQAGLALSNAALYIIGDSFEITSL